MQSNLQYQYYRVAIHQTDNATDKEIRNISRFALQSNKMRHFENQCRQGILDDHEKEVPHMAWSELEAVALPLMQTRISYIEIWAVKTRDYEKFAMELKEWKASNDTTVFSAWWYRKLLDSHIELYELSEILTDEFYKALVNEGKK